MQSIAKHVIEKGTTTLTEHEFTTLLQEHAKLHKAAGESDGAAFSRIFSAPESIDIRRAHTITKNTPAPMMSIDPVQVSGKDATDVNDARKAYDQLTALAEERRRRSPGLTARRPSPVCSRIRKMFRSQHARTAGPRRRQAIFRGGHEFAATVRRWLGAWPRGWLG